MSDNKEKEYAEKAKELNPIDDPFFLKMAEDIGFCQEVIWAATGDKKLKVIKNEPQKTVKNLQGRSVILDLFCENENHDRILIEVQKADDDDHVRRVRYNTSCVTVNITRPGDRFKDVPDIISIYISKSDFISEKSSEKKCAVYHVDRIVRETGQVLNNGVTEIYINTKVKDGSDASKLMTIFTVDDVYDDEKFPCTSDRKRHFKKTEKGVEEMSSVMENLFKEKDYKKAKQLYINGVSPDIIRNIYKDTLDEKDFEKLENEILEHK